MLVPREVSWWQAGPNCVASRTPRQRGVTLFHELTAAGVQTAVSSDNTRDPFYAYGDLDMVEVMREATRILHLDHPYGDWPLSVGARPAAMMGLQGAGVIRAGAPACRKTSETQALIRSGMRKVGAMLVSLCSRACSHWCSIPSFLARVGSAPYIVSPTSG